MFFFAETSLNLPLPENLPLEVKIFSGVLLVLLPVALVVFGKLLRRVDREGPKTRPDLFATPDILAVSFVFLALALLSIPIIIERVQEAMGQAPPAVTVPVSEKTTPSLEEKLAAPGKAKEGLTSAKLAAGMLTMATPVICMLAVFVIRGGRLSDLFGLGKVSFFRALLLGFGFAVLAFSLTSFINVIVTSAFGSKEAPQQLVQSFKNAVSGADPIFVGTITLSATVVAPLVEEFMFRGAFYPVLSRPLGRVPAALFVAIFFALIHDTFTAAPSLTVLALCLTLIYEATGSLWVPIFCHAAFNGINLAISWWFIKLGINP